MPEQKKLKLMLHSLEGTGHLHACIGFGQILRQRGHEVIFAINEALVSKVETFGFRVLSLKQVDENAKEKNDFTFSENPAKDVGEKLKEAGLFSNKTPLEKMEFFNQDGEDSFFHGIKKLSVAFNPQIEKYLEEEKPDAWLHDHFLVPPAVLKAEIPWMIICSAGPLMYYNELTLPPECSGMFLRNILDYF